MNPCPCGLTREELNKHNLVDTNGVCTAFDAHNQPCGRRLVDHPHAPGKNILLFVCLIYFLLVQQQPPPQGKFLFCFFHTHTSY
jgi:hypothetical protein